VVTRARAGGNEAAWCGATVRRASRQMTSSGQHYDHLLKLLLIGDSGRWCRRASRVASSSSRRRKLGARWRLILILTDVEWWVSCAPHARRRGEELFAVEI